MLPHPEDWLTAAITMVRSRTNLVPRVGIILGSGLGGFASEVEAEATLPYREIPGFPVSTAIGHKGQLTLGRLDRMPVAVLEGRFHLYEGYSADQVVRPIHLLRALGIEILIATNAAGGLHPGLRMGDVVVVEDHVNLMWTQPIVKRDQPLSSSAPSPHWRRDLQGEHDCGERAEVRGQEQAGCPPHPHETHQVTDTTMGGEREQEMTTQGKNSSRTLYDPQLSQWAIEAAREAGTSSPRGIYIGMTGPNYETRAEYRWLRRIGDLVGMSTVPEVLAARSLKLRVLALSVVSNECNPDALDPTDGAQVVAAVSRAAGKIRSIVRGTLSCWQSGETDGHECSSGTSSRSKE